MLERQQQMILSQYTQFYDLLILKDHRLRQMNELVDLVSSTKNAKRTIV